MLPAATRHQIRIDPARRKDVGGIREDIRDLRKRDDRDRDEAAEGRARLQDQIDALNT